jgi:hypothetical protein
MFLRILLGVAVLGLGCAQVQRLPVPPPKNLTDAYDKRCHEFVTALHEDRFGDAVKMFEPQRQTPDATFEIRKIWNASRSRFGNVLSWDVNERGGIPGRERRTLVVVQETGRTQVDCTVDPKTMEVIAIRIDQLRN